MTLDLFGNTFNLMEQSLAYANEKNRTISANVANVDTPHYKAKDVTFDQTLNETMNQSFDTKRTHTKHMPFGNEQKVPHKVITKHQTSYNHNGNNVDIDKEMSELAKNQIYYQGLVDRMNGKFNNLQTVIRGGR